jgi:hypothetical protein
MIVDVDYANDCILLMGQEPDMRMWYGSYYDNDLVNQITDDDQHIYSVTKN